MQVAYNVNPVKYGVCLTLYGNFHKCRNRFYLVRCGAVPVSLITPVHPKTLRDDIICIYKMLYERVDDVLVLIYNIDVFVTSVLMFHVGKFIFCWR